MKMIITDFKKDRNYVVRLKSPVFILQDIMRSYEKGVDVVYLPITYMDCLSGDIVCYIIAHNIEVKLESSRNWFKIEGAKHLHNHDITEYADCKFMIKPTFILNPLAIAVKYSKHIKHRPYGTLTFYISNNSLKRLFSVEYAYLFWEYQFAEERPLVDEKTLTYNVFYCEDAIDKLVADGKVEKFFDRNTILYKYIGKPLIKRKRKKILFK